MAGTHPDLEWARMAARGDGAAWRRIMDQSGPALFALLSYQTGSRDEALDLLQETYLQAFRSLDRYRGEGPLGAWLRAIALHKALDWKRTILRRRKRNVSLTDPLARGLASPPETPAEGETPEVRRALAALSPRQRAVVLLREWEGLSFREVARILGGSESTARVQHSRACARLRRLLAGTGLRLPEPRLEGQGS
jgi:RNA polymerase sigma factor (sigma-70 family)